MGELERCRHRSDQGAEVMSKSKLYEWLLTGGVAFVMIGGGLSHLMTPQGFAPLVPSFLPALPVILGAGVLQIAIGLAAVIPRYRIWGGLAFAALCFGYLPLHVWDFFRPDPVFPPPVAATIRVVVQLLFIAIGLQLAKLRTK